MPPFTFPVCNSFKPVILDGRICQQFDSSRIKMDMKSGKENGLMFIVDTNGDRSLDVAEEVENSFTDDTLSFDVETQDLSTSGAAEIHINTLAPFYGDGPGDYVISSLKKMTGTKNFLALPDNEKRCQIEDFVECKNRNFFAQGKLLCGNCIPWILQMALNDIEVMLLKIN